MNKKVLVYGFGNPGRQDDGLGPALVEMLESDELQGILLDSNYQLNIEDAHSIADCEYVIFVDASIGIDEAFSFYEIKPSNEITFTTHAISPQSVLALSHDLYQTKVKGFVLEIKGTNWDFAEGLSPTAVKNLKRAYRFLKSKLSEMVAQTENCCNFGSF